MRDTMLRKGRCFLEIDLTSPDEGGVISALSTFFDVALSTASQCYSRTTGPGLPPPGPLR